MKKTAKRLTLNKETLRNLAHRHLHFVAGGSVNPAEACSETCYTCASFCKNCQAEEPVTA
jgi:hypothetical protein